MSDSKRLLAPPDWGRAAQALIDACSHLPDPAQRLDFIDGACRALGPRLYPAFLEVLMLVSARGSPPAQAAVADTLADALSSGRVPAAQGTLGPIEYVCAQYLQPANAVQAVSAPVLEAALRPLLRLVAQSPRALGLYCDRLALAARDPMDSLWTRPSRPALLALATQWRSAPDQPDAAVDALLHQTESGSARSLRVFGTAGHWAAHLR